ncbi:VanZ family protein [Carboxylicivirga taeanensis]|uniref:VanZ family protein n=1 Tax=Carboxylicivirga taeanensis TaxID=1416875 RepID=UPI003F6DF4B6
MIYYFKKYHKTLSVIFFITLLSLINTSNIPKDTFKLLPHFDKIVHFLMYFTLGFTFMFEYYIHHHQTLTKISSILVLPLIYGGLMEVLQMSITSYRSGDWWDMLANGSGIIMAFFAVRVFRNNAFIKKCILYPLKQPLAKV